MSDKLVKAPEPVFRIIECKECGRCIVSCARKVLKISDQLNHRGYHYVEYTGTGCTGCMNCYYTCPEPNAVEIHIPLKD